MEREVKPKEEVIPNPYSRRSAISVRHEFFGREKEMTEIFQLLEQQQSIALIGERRAGKSSILNAIDFLRRESKLSEDVRLIFVNCLYAEESPEQRFIKHMLYQITSALKIDKLPPERDSLIDAAEDARSRGYTLVILMDEVDVIVDNPKIPKDLFSFFRAWSENYRIPFVVTSREGKIEPLLRFTSVGSPFWNSLKTVYVGPFTHAETLNLTLTPAYLSGQPFTDEQVEWIHAHGGHHPFFTQIAAYAVFGQPKLNPERWHAAFMMEASQHFEYMLDVMEEKQCDALAEFLHGAPLSPRMKSDLLLKGILIEDYGEPPPFSSRLQLFSVGLEEKLRSRYKKSTATAASRSLIDNVKELFQG
jgi:hypothetical protein